MAKKTLSSSQRGYGGRHKRIRQSLLAQLVDGTPCSWCGKPMYKDKERNFDKAALEADHERSIKYFGKHQNATRLLHRRCNRQRGAGNPNPNLLDTEMFHVKHKNDVKPTDQVPFSW